MKNNYYYDIECFPNYFCVTFIPLSIKEEDIDKFVDLDIHLLSTIEDRFVYEGSEALWENIQYYIKPRIFEVYKNEGDIKELYKFVKNECGILIGFNNSQYDDVLLDLIAVNHEEGLLITNKLLYHLSGRIINASSDGNIARFNFIELRNYVKPYISLDLMRLNYLDKKRISLKQVSIVLKWYKVQDFELDFMSKEEYIKFVDDKDRSNIDDLYSQYLKTKSFLRPIREQDIPGIQLYNINDVLLLWKLHKESLGELRVRMFVNKHYGIPLERSMNASRSSLADILLIKFYEDQTNQLYYQFKYKQTERKNVFVKDCIFPTVSFKGNVKTSVYKIRRKTSGSKAEYVKLENIHNLVDFYNLICTLSIRDTNEIEYVLTINDTDYTFASGGLHSKDKPGILESNDKIEYIDADVSSYYPSMVVNHNIEPAHLKEGVFVSIADMVVKERIEAKRLKADPDMKDKADVLKIVANAGFFGKFGSKYSWLKDIKALVSVTINGQLLLLMPIEELESKGFKVVNANTDGFVTAVPIERKKEYMDICSAWEAKTGFSLEFTEYAKYIRRDVNHYVAKTKNGKIKSKGAEFNSELDLAKGYKYPVIPMAIEAHFFEGKPIKEFILNHRDILDFCISQRVGSDYIPEYHYVDKGEMKIKTLQKNIRYFVSKSGGVLMKRNRTDGRLISLIKNRYCIVINNLFYVEDFKDYNIDYNFYFAEADKIWQSVYGQLNLDKANSKMKTGTLFD